MLIDSYQGYLGKAIKFYSCFISHSTVDQVFAKRLHADLQDNAVRCWFAPHDLRGGKELDKQIDDAIRVHDKLLLLLSENSIRSEWVKREIRKAKARKEREGRKVLFPIRLVDWNTLAQWEFLDPTTGRDFAEEVRRFYIPDFSTWEVDQATYRKEFDKLLRDLKPPGEEVPS